jgi:hypothetical protein
MADAEVVGEFYSALEELEGRLGGKLTLGTCTRQDVWAKQGIYFFFEPGEHRIGSGSGLRVVRVGSHGLGDGGRRTLWSRLRDHRGPRSGGGNHRTSIFRRHIGNALFAVGRVAPVPGWEIRRTAPSTQRVAEAEAEAAVSSVIRSMPFLWLPVADVDGVGSERAYLESNSIAVLSGLTARGLDPASAAWLGKHAPSSAIRESGLWNVRDVGRTPDRDFVLRLRTQVGFVTRRS